MPVMPICTAGSRIGGQCLVGLQGKPDHYQTGISPVFINGVQITTSLDLSTGHTGVVSAVSPGAAANTLGGLSSTRVTVDPELTVLTRVFVNGVPVVRAGDMYLGHAIQSLRLFHLVCEALSDQTSVFAV